MKDKLKKLAEPFADSEIEWRIGSTTKDKKKAMMLPYVTNRAIMNRLDDVIGSENWKATFREIHKGIICTLSIRLDADKEWITKEDGADLTNIEATKGGLSDSMKRAAVHFGMGRYLYEAETEWVELNEAGYPKNKPAKVRFTKRITLLSLEEAFTFLAEATTLEELTAKFRELSPAQQKDTEIIAKAGELKIKLTQ